MSKRGLQGTWLQALVTFFSPFLVFLFFRWAIAEPFVIPSGSMIPSLLIHDHVIVTKFSYGLKLPFSDRWLVQWRSPQRGDVVVFKYPDNPEIYYIKRLIGLPGDQISVKAGLITINGEALAMEPHNPVFEDNFDYFSEKINETQHVVRFLKIRNTDEQAEYKVPENQYFFIGDNRDQSSDGRVWGFVPEQLIVGPAQVIWLSCGDTLQSAQFICNPQTIRWKRLMTLVR